MSGRIAENQELHMANVLSCRVKGTQQEFQAALARAGRFVEGGGYASTGPVATATFSVEAGGGVPVIDAEALIPLDRPFEPPEGCSLKPEFRLVNAAVIRHEGNPSGLQETVNELVAYMQQKNLTPITPAYNVAVREARSPAELDEAIVDVYIGTSPNIL
jgi:effector-binding domain-containing protein